MASSVVTDPPASVTVGMGQISVQRTTGRLTAVLGSCVGVILAQPRLQVAALAHVVLPQSSGRDGTAGKFADTAVPAMIEQLERLGALRNGLVAKIAGGACMFGNGGPMQIGDNNIMAVVEALRKHGLSVAARDVGGHSGRRVSVDCSDGRVTIEVAGQPPRSL